MEVYLLDVYMFHLKKKSYLLYITVRLSLKHKKTITEMSCMFHWTKCLKLLFHIYRMICGSVPCCRTAALNGTEWFGMFITMEGLCIFCNRDNEMTILNPYHTADPPVVSWLFLNPYHTADPPVVSWLFWSLTTQQTLLSYHDYSEPLPHSRPSCRIMTIF